MFYQNRVTSIRILPNDKNTFQSEYEFKSFVENVMPKRGGYYYYPNLMMNCDPYTLVLFQYDGKIRAVGVLLDAQKTQVFDEKGIEYAGYYKFDVDSIKYLSRPIDVEIMRTYYPKFIAFNQAKQRIPIEYWKNIFEMLKKTNQIDVM